MPAPAPTSAAPSNTPAPTVSVVAQPTIQAGGDDNASLLAELEAEQAGKGPPPATEPGTAVAPAKPVKPAIAAEPAPEGDEPATAAGEPAAAEDEEPDEPPLEDEDLEDEGPAGDPDDEDPATAAAADKDPALKARLDAVRRTEERQRARFAQERQSFDRERQQFIDQRGQAIQRLQQFDQLAARAKYDLPSVVRALGIEPADFEYHAQSLMAHSPKFADKAEYRQAQERAMREREAADEARQARAEAAEVKKMIADRDQQAAADRELDTYFARTMRKATDSTMPITAALIKNGPKAARAALTVTANELFQKLGRMPNPTELLTAHERKESRALQLRGIKPAPAAKAAAAVPAVNGANGTKPAPAGGTKPNGQTAPAKPGKPPAAAAPPATPAAAPPPDPHKIPSRDELLAELASGAAN